jgi:hypothetical protein
MANPTAPVGPLKIGTVGIDQAGNVWGMIAGKAPIFIATMPAPLPLLDEQPAQTPPPPPPAD